MGFRSDRDASRYRIEALESALEEKDAEIARLRAEAEGKRAHDAKDARRKATRENERSAPTGAPPAAILSSLPDGDTWALPISAGLELMPILVGGVGGLIAGYARDPSSLGLGEPRFLLTLLPAVLVVVALWFALTKRVVLDRRAGTVRVHVGLLKRTIKGKSFQVRGFVVSSENGPTVKKGRVAFGMHRLMAASEPEACALAERMAAFMGVPYLGVRFSEKEQEREGMQALVLTFATVAVGAAVWGVSSLLAAH